MKPLRLSMAAVGPFLDRQEIDFEGIAAGGLFLIHGPTGQGKSFIFDAICYALFGSTPSGRESNLRSDYAQPGVEPMVEFAFNLGQAIYVVRRTLAYARDKKKGEGLTEEPESQSLVKLSSWPDGQQQTLATKKTAVGNEVRKLLGLDPLQFQQVVLLPQGEFRRLLLADSASREELLERLFDASFYESIQGWFDQQDRQKRKATAELKTRMEEILRQAWAKLPPDSRPAEAEATTRPAVEQGLLRLAEDLAEKATLATGRKQHLDASQAALNKAKALLDEFEKHRLAQNQLASLEEQRGMIDAQRQQEKSALAASKLDPLLARRTDAANCLAAAAGKLEDGRKACAKQETAWQEASRQAERLPELEKVVDTLARQEILVRPLSTAAEKLVAKTDSADQAKRHLAARQQAVAEIAKQVSTRHDEIVKTRDALIKNKALAVDSSALTQRREKMAALKASLAQQIMLGNRLSELAKDVGAAEKQVAAAEQELGELRRRREANLAAELAAELAADAPCPVCGSRNHPALAKADTEAASLEEIKKAEGARQNCLRVLGQGKDNIARVETQVEGTVAAIREALEKLQCDAPPANLEAQLDELDKRLASERKRQVDEQQLTARLDAQQQQLEDLNTRQTAAAAELDAASLAMTASSTDLAAAQEHWQTALAALEDVKLAAKCSDSAAIKAICKELETRLGETRKTIVDTRQKLASAQSELAKAKTAVAERQQAVVLAEQAHQAATAAFTTAIGGSPFADENEFEAARRNEQWLEETHAVIQQFDRHLHEWKIKLEQAGTQIAGQDKPELPSLEQAVEEADAALQTATADKLKLEAAIADLRALMESLAKLHENSADLIAELEILGRLAEELRGQRPPKISLKRFFLAQRLDEVLIEASRRMDVLSAGRFVLKRETQERNRQSQTGLELVVYDSYTNTERPANTLSGGQLFLASLSMALGLATVVQARSGAVRLDTLFVDEGFGTLDEETLQLAMRVLNDLRGENRLVGVVSHVTELRRQIANCIEVKPAKIGSTLAVTIGS